MVEIVVTPSPTTTVTVSPSVTPSTAPSEVIVYEGQPGPKGDKGDPGEPGETQTISFIHTQNAVSSTWSITHNLGFYPNVQAQDSSGTTIEGSMRYVNANQLTIEFSVGTTGTAYLS
jgi:hypothetical protein